MGNLGMVQLSFVLLGVMVVLLASGVWIAVSLGLVGFVAMALTTDRAARQRACHHDLECERVLDVGRAAVVHLDGGDSLSHQTVGGDVSRPVALASMAARAVDACERYRLRHLRGGIRLLGSDLRDHRQDCVARTRQARLRQEPQSRLTGGFRNARSADPAVDPDGGLCGDRQCFGAAGFPRRLPAGRARDGALLRLHHCLVAAQSRQDSTARPADAVPAENAASRRSSFLAFCSFLRCFSRWYSVSRPRPNALRGALPARSFWRGGAAR